MSAFLHPSLRKTKTGLKSRIHGVRTMHRDQHVLDMDAQYRCIETYPGELYNHVENTVDTQHGDIYINISWVSMEPKHSECY